MEVLLARSQVPRSGRVPSLMEGKSRHRWCTQQAEAPKGEPWIERARHNGPKWLMLRKKLIAVIAISIATLGPAAAQSGDDKVKITITLDEAGLKGKPESVLGAWMGYGIARANWLSENVLVKPDAVESYHRCFEEELAGRESLAKIWIELKQSNSKLSDEYLDQIVSVRRVGFLSEYVWSYLGSADWKQAPEQLRLEAFEKWKATNLPGHKPQTFADVKFEPKTQ